MLTGEIDAEPYKYKLSELGPSIKSFTILEGSDDFIKTDTSNQMIIIDPKQIQQGLKSHILKVNTTDDNGVITIYDLEIDIIWSVK